MSDTGVMFIQEAVMMVALVALVGWVMWLLFRRYQVRVQEGARRLELFGKLVDKFGDSKDFVGFVQSDEGRKLLKDSGVNGASVRQVALRMILVAALLFSIGAGFLVGSTAYEEQIGSATYEQMSGPNYVNKVADLQYWGRMAFGLAAGFIAAGVLTYLFGGDGKASKRA